MRKEMDYFLAFFAFVSLLLKLMSTRNLLEENIKQIQCVA